MFNTTEAFYSICYTAVLEKQDAYQHCAVPHLIVFVSELFLRIYASW